MFNLRSRISLFAVLAAACAGPPQGATPDPVALGALEREVAQQFAFRGAVLRQPQPRELTLTLPDSLLGYDATAAEPIERGGVFRRQTAVDSVAAYLWHRYGQAAGVRRLVVQLEFRNDQGTVTQVRGYDAAQLRRLAAQS